MSSSDEDKPKAKRPKGNLADKRVKRRKDKENKKMNVSTLKVTL